MNNNIKYRVLSSGLERFLTTYDIRSTSHKRSESVESQVLYTNKVLGIISLLHIEEKLESAMRGQHQLEDKLEEFEVQAKQAQDKTNATTKMFTGS